MRYLVVSDIHGVIEKFERVLYNASYNPEEDQLILLGDYIDRGPHSREVVEKVQKLVEKDGAIAIKGNHDDLFIRSPYDPSIRQIWELNGGSSTRASYNGDLEQMQRHREWLESYLHLYYETEDFIFVHAGLLPKVPLEKQKEQTMLWTRHMERIGLGKTVVHGHTPVREVAYYEDQVDIDTGAVYGGKLTLLELPSHQVYSA